MKDKKLNTETGSTYVPSPSLSDITQTAATIAALLGLPDDPKEWKTDIYAADTVRKEGQANGESPDTSRQSTVDRETGQNGAENNGQRVYSSKPFSQVLGCADRQFGRPRADRVFMYNPDAIGYWIYKKYASFFAPLLERTQLTMKLATVYPPVTPACFGSMYTGLLPEQHGITKYEKFILKVPTLFDMLPSWGKRTAIVSTSNDSISILFLERDVDYFIYDTIRECNEKAKELISAGSYDVIILYNGNYDYWMHRNTPTGPIAKRQLKENIRTFCELHELIRCSWTDTDNVLAFAPDHGCHRWLGLLGNHGDMIQKDMEITHFYSFIPKQR